MTSTKHERAVALVTGAGSGLGAAIAETLAMDGMAVVVADLRTDKARGTTQRLTDGGFEAYAVEVDVGDEQSVAACIESAVGRYGRLDALINNAAIDITVSIEELSVADWTRVLHTNLHGPFLMAKFALKHLKQARGSIVNICSTASRRAWPNASAYHATKWGLLGLSHALHAELRAQGVKVTAVLAGGMRTPFLLDRFPDLDPNVLQDPVNVARAVRFALSMPEESVIPELMVLPMRETSLP